MYKGEGMSVPHRKLIYGRFLILPALFTVLIAAMTASSQLSAEYGTGNLGAAAAVFVAVLMLLLFIGWCVNHCFPGERKQDFKVLLFICGTLLFCAITAVGLELRINFMRIFNVVVDDYGIYGAADILRSGTRPKAGSTLFEIFTKDPEYYACTAFQSVLLSVFGYRGEVPAYANLFFELTGALCAAGTAYVFGGRLSAIAVYALLLCLPQEAAFVVRMEGTPLSFAVLMAAVFLFAVTVGTEKNDCLTVVPAVLYLMDGLLFGIAFFLHPVTLVIIVSLFLFLCFLREKAETHPAAFGCLMGAFYLTGACITFFTMLFLKARDLKTALSVVGYPYLECFLPENPGRFFINYRDAWNAHFYPAMPEGYTSNLENEITIVILLCFCFIVLVFAFAWKRKGAVPACALLLGLSWLCGCGRLRQDSHLMFLSVLLLAGFLPQEFYWLFCVQDEKMPLEEALLEELPDVHSDLKEDEEPDEKEIPENPENPPKKEIHFLENPLPGPKKHVPKTMDFDIDVLEDDDFDI